MPRPGRTGGLCFWLGLAGRAGRVGAVCGIGEQPVTPGGLGPPCMACPIGTYRSALA
jgi:hypothetical protein